MLKKGRRFESCLLHDAILSRIISISFITGRNDPVKGIVSQFFPTTVLLFSHLSPISLFFGALYLGWIGSENLGGEFWPVDTGQRRSPQGIPTHPLNPSSRERSRTVVVEKSNHCHWHTALSPLQGMKDILVIFVKDKLWKALYMLTITNRWWRARLCLFRLSQTLERHNSDFWDASKPNYHPTTFFIDTRKAPFRIGTKLALLTIERMVTTWKTS